MMDSKSEGDSNALLNEDLQLTPTRPMEKLKLAHRCASKDERNQVFLMFNQAIAIDKKTGP